VGFASSAAGLRRSRQRPISETGKKLGSRFLEATTSALTSPCACGPVEVVAISRCCQWARLSSGRRLGDRSFILTLPASTHTIGL